MLSFSCITYLGQFALSIADSKDSLNVPKWCAAGDLAGCNIFSYDIEGNTKNETEISLA